MITLTRLTGAVFALNPDLVERIDQTPDTVITLVDGTKYLVRQSLREIVLAVRDYRASVLAEAGRLESGAVVPMQGAEDRWLAAVPADGEGAPVLSFSREDQ